MMAPGDLVTLAAVKSWLKVEDLKANPDQELARLIRSASAAVLNYCNKNAGFGWVEQVNIYDGNGMNFLVMREDTVTDIVSIDLGNGTLLTTPSTGSPPSNGFLIPDDTKGQQRLVLRGYCFPRGRSNITVTYHAGFRVLNEAQTVGPATGVDALSAQVALSWLGDLGVTLANGTPLAPVPASPAAMQYSVADGVYLFNVAQALAPVLISYQQCPDDVAEAAIELVGERYKVRNRIGEVSHAMGGQTNTTTAFSQKDMNDFIKAALRPYRKVAPA